jgi:alcohol dehydrogenase YqhD (iron-dependent ADH family)
MRFASVVISLPLLLGAVQLAQPISLAQAAAIDAEQAMVLLSKSHAINAKCGFLSADKSQELKDFIARAEISLATKASVTTARKAINAGKAQGKGAVCDEAARKLVNDVLAAANAAAVATVTDETKTAEPEPKVAATIPAKPEAQAVAVAEQEPEKPVAAKPLEDAQPKKVIVSAKQPKPKAEKPLKKPVNGLGSYAAVAEKYFMARRCGTMSASQISSLYKTVLANHKQALVTNKARDVRAMLISAESRAGTKSCT